MGPDFEVIKILTELLDELNIGSYEVKLNHRKLLDGMLDICGVPPEKFRTICSSIDKLDKQSFDQVKKEMVEEKGLTVEIADRIGSFVKDRGSPLELLAKLKQEGSEFLKHEGSALALTELEILFKALEKAKGIDNIVFDLSLARGLDYYTGVIYEAVFKGTTQLNMKPVKKLIKELKDKTGPYSIKVKVFDMTNVQTSPTNKGLLYQRITFADEENGLVTAWTHMMLPVEGVTMLLLLLGLHFQNQDRVLQRHGRYRSTKSKCSASVCPRRTEGVGVGAAGSASGTMVQFYTDDSPGLKYLPLLYL